jgi:carbamoyl-phosphate synthase small subunit
MVVKWDPTEPSNWRAAGESDPVAGEDRPHRHWRDRHPPPDPRHPPAGRAACALAHDPEGKFDIEKLVAKARAWKGLVGLDLAKDVTCAQSYRWDEKRWAWPEGYTRREGAGFRVVAIDYGAKRNILRCLASVGCEVTVLPATATAEDVLALNPEGVFLSNGPGDPAATGAYAVPMIQGVLAKDLPLFGICLGHQMLALALGCQDPQDEPRPPRREPSGQGPDHRQGRDHLDEPRLYRRCRHPAKGRE